MFVDIKIVLLSRAVVLMTVLAIGLGFALDDLAGLTGSGDFSLLDPKALLLGLACYLALGNQCVPPRSQAGKDAHRA